VRTLISGHRLHKLTCYDPDFIELAIEDALADMLLKYGFVTGLSGMASGVDLWFCDACSSQGSPYWACVPFEGQEETMDESSASHRDSLLAGADKIVNVKNRWMVENSDTGIVVWDGNKGGTHNVFQQLVEARKDFLWVNPVKESLVWC